MKLNIVPARQGLYWARQGARTFRQQPLALASLFLVFMVLMSVISLLPYLGTVLVLGLLPTATLGFMVITRESTGGQFPSPALLAKALRVGQQEARSLVILGLLYALGFLAVMGLGALLDGGLFARFYLAGDKISRAQMAQPEFQQALWMTTALNLPLSLLFWHAPALVHWHQVPPIKALFFSLVACVRNLGAYLVFGLTWLLAFMLVSQVMMLLVAALAGMDAALATLLPLASLFTALIFTSLYYTFDACFRADQGSPSQ